MYSYKLGFFLDLSSEKKKKKSDTSIAFPHLPGHSPEHKGSFVVVENHHLAP